MPSEYAKDISDIKVSVGVLLERSMATLEQLTKLNGKVVDLDKQVDTNCTEIAKLQTGQGVWAGINTALTLLAASVAAWIGTRR